MKLRIHVTKEILERSKFCGHMGEDGEDWIGTDEVASNCAVALAVRDIFGNALVSQTEISTIGGIIQLPPEAALFIDDFDASSPVERVFMNTISFEIEVPDKLIDKINIEDLKKSKTLELVN